QPVVAQPAGGRRRGPRGAGARRLGAARSQRRAAVEEDLSDERGVLGEQADVLLGARLLAAGAAALDLDVQEVAQQGRAGVGRRPAEVVLEAGAGAAVPLAGEGLAGGVELLEGAGGGEGGVVPFGGRIRHGGDLGQGRSSRGTPHTFALRCERAGGRGEVIRSAAGFVG